MASNTTSPADKQDRPARSSPLQVLAEPMRELGEIAGARLSAALMTALRQAADRAFAQAAQALTSAEREAWLDASEFPRLRRDALVQRFGMHFEQRYARACQRSGTSLAGFSVDFDISQLKIVEHDILDDALEQGVLAEAIQNACWLDMNQLSARFAQCLDCRYAMPGDFPVGPKLIEAALTDALLELPWRHEAKRMLMRVLRVDLVPAIGWIYRDLLTRMSPTAAPGALRDTLRGEIPEPSPPASDWLELPAESGSIEAPEPARSPAPPSPPATPAPLSPPAAPPLPTNGEEARHVELRTSAGTSPPTPLPARQDDALAADRASSQGVAPASTQALHRPARQAAPPAPRGDEAAPLTPDALACGDHLMFAEPSGSMRELKLAWISPHRSLFILANPAGERALCLGVADLGAALAEGRARRVSHHAAAETGGGPASRASSPSTGPTEKPPSS